MLPKQSNNQLERIPAYGITKGEYERWTERTGRAYTDPWMSVHVASRPKSSPEYAARNKKEMHNANA